jgi:hypothetical protein
MLEIANQSYNHKGSCRTQTFNNMCIRSSFFFGRRCEMKFASVKQAVKFGIGAGLPPDKQTSVKTVKSQTTSSPPAGISNSIK